MRSSELDRAAPSVTRPLSHRQSAAHQVGLALAVIAVLVACDDRPITSSTAPSVALLRSEMDTIAAAMPEGYVLACAPGRVARQGAAVPEDVNGNGVVCDMTVQNGEGTTSVVTLDDVVRPPTDAGPSETP